jgi:hypothetical protein
MKSLSVILISIFSVLVIPAMAQVKPSFKVSGYLSNMQSVMYEDIHGQWISDNLFHNRLNFNASFGSIANFSVEMRNRLIFGETVKYNPDYSALVDRDQGWIDMSRNILSDTSYILNSTVDRAYADFTIGKLQATIGRQRINWGLNYIWNPNDIFNNYSFFDFDYVEKPGSDALRLQYFINATSSTELVIKINSQGEWSAAGLWRLNWAGTDFQFLSGLLNEKELVVGSGISGYLGPVSINAEITHLRPIKESINIKPATVGGVGLSYNSPFNLFLQFEYLYNSSAGNLQLTNFSDFYYRDLSIRELSIAPHSFFTSLSYPVTHIWNLGLAGMVFPKISGIFLGPTMDLSLRADLDLSFYWQYFSLAFQESTQKINMAFLRLKWSF